MYVETDTMFLGPQTRPRSVRRFFAERRGVRDRQTDRLTDIPYNRIIGRSSLHLTHSMRSNNTPDKLRSLKPLNGRTILLLTLAETTRLSLGCALAAVNALIPPADGR